MREIKNEELKILQLAILDSVDRFCRENGIHYWLDCGTLLGAIRHNGYIPWDDDIDIGMLRNDFNRFIREFKTEGNRYTVHCIDVDSSFCYPYAKVLDNNTVLYEPDQNGNKISVNIDVFVYDNAPDDNDALEKMFDRRDFYRSANVVRTTKIHPHGNLAVKIWKLLIVGGIRLFPRNYFARKMSQNAQKYAKERTERVGNFTSYTRTFCSRNVFDAFIDHAFEGRMYQIPIGYDEWLKSFYGDYMQLPPEEKRVSHHKFVAFVNE